jgi:hypothetical protein
MPTEYDWRDLAAATDPATEHLPTERAVLLREIMRLRAQGLRVRDVAECLGLNPGVIENLIEGHEPGSGSV